MVHHLVKGDGNLTDKIDGIDEILFSTGSVKNNKIIKNINLTLFNKSINHFGLCYNLIIVQIIIPMIHYFVNSINGLKTDI